VKLGKVGLTAVVAGALLLAPVAAVAATGGFSSSNSGTALTAKNTSTGLAIDASTANGTSFRSTSGGTGNGSALFLRQNATGDGSNGLYAKAYPTSGEHYGAWGVNATDEGAGVRGQSASPFGLGVLGEGGFEGGAGVVGSGSAGVVGAGGYGVVSFGDLLASGEFNTDDDRIAGVCTVFNGTGNCFFSTPLFPGETPIVTVTPQANPGGSFWVESPSEDGFTIKTEADVSLNFAYHVVAIFPDGLSQTSAKAATAEALRAKGR
jgi:hypothetical protein